MATASAPRLRLAPDARREQILECAVRVFAERSYADVSTSDLAREAGVTRSLINHYYGDKRGLYLVVVRKMLMMPRGSLDAIEADNLRARVDASIDRILEVAVTYGRAWVRFSGAGGISDDREVAEIVTAADDRAAELVLQALGFDVTGPEGARLRTLVRAFASLVKAACREWLIEGNLTRDDAHLLLSTTLTALITAETE